MRTAEIAGSAATGPVRSAGTGAESRREVVAALAGKEAGRERAVAEKTRRVVMASLGVMQEQEAGRKRSYSLALASILVVLLALGPFVWHVAYDVVEGEPIGALTTQMSLWACVLCPVILAAVLVAGWMRGKP